MLNGKHHMYNSKKKKRENTEDHKLQILLIIIYCEDAANNEQTRSFFKISLKLKNTISTYKIKCLDIKFCQISFNLNISFLHEFLIVILTMFRKHPDKHILKNFSYFQFFYFL